MDEFGHTNKVIANFIIHGKNGNSINGELIDLIDPLDELEFPDREIIYNNDDFLRNSKIKMFMSGRGCPYKCTYCFNHMYNKMYKGKGKIIRKKSVDYFIEEINRVKHNYSLEGIIFEDDIFIINEEWLNEFAEKYSKKISLPYMCYVRPNLVNKQIARLLKKSGCHSARVAIECGNQDLRNKILKRNLTDNQILKSCEILHNEDLKVGTINILGLPTETIDNMYETLKLNRQCKPHHVSANMFMPLPGVDLTYYAIEQGLLDKEFEAPKSSHHISEMKYPIEIRDFLYPYKALFPIMVRNRKVEKWFKILRKVPRPILRFLDSVYRLYRNKILYPPVKFGISDTLRAVKRYFSIIS